MKNRMRKKIKNKIRRNMSINEIVLLTIYAVESSDGKLQGELSNVIPYMLNIPKEAIEEKIGNYENISKELKKYPKEAIEAVVSIAKFIIHADGTTTTDERNIVNKLKELLK